MNKDTLHWFLIMILVVVLGCVSVATWAPKAHAGTIKPPVVPKEWINPNSMVERDQPNIEVNELIREMHTVFSSYCFHWAVDRANENDDYSLITANYTKCMSKQYEFQKNKIVRHLQQVYGGPF